TIIAVDGRPVSRQAQLRHRIVSRYAGDEVTIGARRGTEKLERRLTLVRELPPYERPMLGLLPMRDPSAGGVEVRAVDAGGPAEKAGVRPGDRITAIDSKPIKKRDDLIAQLAGKSVGDTVSVKVTRGSESLALPVPLAAWNASVSPTLPAARKQAGELPAERPAVGEVKISIPEFKNECTAYVPDNNDPRVAYGVVVWPQAANKSPGAELIDAWKELAEANDLILLVPRSAEREGWKPGEAEFIRKALAEVIEKYNVEPARTIVYAADTSAPIAWRSALALGGVVSGLVAVDAPPPPGVQLPSSDPGRPLAVYVARFADSPSARRLDATVRDLRAKKHSVTVKDLPGRVSAFNEAQREELVRWIDVLDRL
ncbi:MAG: PDZ domain-containing protein, partial [Pirellulales bacterium]